MKNIIISAELVTCVICLGILFPISSNGQSTIQVNSDLKKEFQNPPTTALPKTYWWWLNGNVNPERLKEELIAMKDAGIVGVDIFDIGGWEVPNPDNMIPAGPAFMGEKSLEYIRFAIEEAGKLDMEVNLSLSSSWNAGGKWVEPETASKTLYSSKTEIEGSKKQRMKLPFPEITPSKNGKPRHIKFASNGRPVFYKEVAVLAIPKNKTVIDTSEILNVSNHFNIETEILNWDAPPGEWEIFRYICANSGMRLNSPSPNSNGLVIDHFDPTATKTHLMYFINRLKPLLGNFSETALKGFYLASYEASDLHWTLSLPDEFKKEHGYELFKFIPAIFNKDMFSPEYIENFQYDFKKTKSNMMIKNHYGKAKEISNQHGLNLISEAGGPGGWHSIPVEALKALGALDIPRGEFWNKYEIHDIGDNIDVKWLVKEIAAASNIYEQGLVEMEAFTSWQNWQEGPKDLKPLADRAFCEGMNRVIIHGFSHEPSSDRYPGIAFYAGTHFNDRNVWWQKVKPFNEYLGRISHILQEAKFVSDVLYYNGDDVPNLVPPKNTHFYVGPGYDYEVVNTEILLDKVTVEDGQLSIPGVAKYKLLYIGENTQIDPLVLTKLGKLAEEGALIIGTKPNEAMGLGNRQKNDEMVNMLANKYWITATAADINAQSFQRGVIYSNIIPIQALQELGTPPDFTYNDPQSSILDYIHYKKEGLDFYLVRNTTDRWISRTCFFRQEEKVPEIWDPVSGEIYPISIFNQHKKQMEIPLTLPPFGSYFVVFKDGNSSSKYTQALGFGQYPPDLEYTKNGVLFLEKGVIKLRDEKGSREISNEPEIFQLGGDWNLYFPDNWGAPASAVFPNLISWTEATDKGIKYFSGTATYSKIFKFEKIEKGNVLYLDLGDLAEVAEVWLNDKPLGITWTKPHRFEISDIIKEGENSLRVEVANTWTNRLVGDAIYNESYTKTNISEGNPNLLLDHFIKPNNQKVPWEEISLIDSGLFGPVTIQTLKPF